LLRTTTSRPDTHRDDTKILKRSGLFLGLFWTIIPILCDHSALVGVVLHEDNPAYRLEKRGPVDPTLLARWQFGIVTVYHFLFVPLTIGLSFTVAVMQTMHYRTKDPIYRRMTKFWGKLFLINFAVGVVTGIVQEFQFGMNWSNYSRFVGDIFGAPLAIEALVAFFLESTFLGLWIFGWDKLSPKVHLLSIWLVTLGTWISAFWILLANSWMQNPVGYIINPETGRAEMESFSALVTNRSLWVHFPHTILAGLATGAAVVLAISAWHLARKQNRDLFTRSARIAAIILLIGSTGVAFSGHAQGQVMTDIQPMKMAAAEALWETEEPAAFSIFAVGNIEEGRNSINIQLPRLLSLLAENDFSSAVEGINPLQEQLVQEYGPGDYIPNVGLLYWTFRIMTGAGFVMIGIGALGLWLMRKRKIPESALFLKLAMWGIALPFIANSTGWIFTEMGRQPWSVYGVLRTADSASPVVPAGAVLFTMIGYTVIYGVLAAVDLYLMARYAKADPAEETSDADIAAAMAY